MNTEHDTLIPQNPETPVREDVPFVEAIPVAKDVGPALLDEADRSLLRGNVRRAPIAFHEALLQHAETHGGLVGATRVDVPAARKILTAVSVAKARMREQRRALRLLADDVLRAESDLALRALATLAAFEAEARVGTREQRLDARELRALQSRVTRLRKKKVVDAPPLEPKK